MQIIPMNQAPDTFVILVTTPDLSTARMLAEEALQQRLAACATFVPGVESHYWWQGKIESSSEVLILFKTTSLQTPSLEKLILAKHPYETPEFVVLPMSGISSKYQAWLRESTIPL